MPDEWRLPVDDDGYVTLPPELLAVLGWSPGDALEFETLTDGTIHIRKESPVGDKSQAAEEVQEEAQVRSGSGDQRDPDR